MKRFFQSFTLLQLILVGFGAVIVPLVAAIGIGILQSETFAESTRAALISVEASIDNSRRLSAAARDLERSTRQYLALEDPEILSVYRAHHRHVLTLLDTLRDVSENTTSDTLLDVLDAAIADLHRYVESIVASRQGRPSSIRRVSAGVAARMPADERRLAEMNIERDFDRLRANSMQLLAFFSQRSRELSQELPRQASRHRLSLMLLAATVIPLSVALAAIFLVLARRPLRQLDAGIRALGDGALNERITIYGARDLTELGERLDWLRQRLTALEEQKVRFLREVSHELKTPLTNIREASELLLDESKPADNQEAATITRILHENTLRLHSLIEELLRFAAADNTGLEHEPLQLDQLVSEAISRQAVVAKARRLEMQASLSPAPVRGNARQIGIVVENLLSNAIKFSPECGRIDIRVSRNAAQAQLDVVDGGPGVNKAHREHIFRWFFRSDRQSRDLIASTGMGLAIAREYTRLHAGTLQLIPSTQGAHFRFSLPMWEGEL